VVPCLRRHGTGINSPFVKEVQIKTGGFEPQYGHVSGGSAGGTKAGGTKFSETVGGYINSRGTRDTIELGRPQVRGDQPRRKPPREREYEGRLRVGAIRSGPCLRDTASRSRQFQSLPEQRVLQACLGTGLFALPIIDRKYNGAMTTPASDFKLNDGTRSNPAFGRPSPTNPTALDVCTGQQSRTPRG